MDRDQGHKAFWNGVPTKTQSQGTATHVFAAFHPSLDSLGKRYLNIFRSFELIFTITLLELNGSYLSDSKVVNRNQVHSWGRDPIDAEKLWKLSEKLVSQEFAY
jgi:hypothetical protein